MKTLHKFIVRSYLGPFVITFFISLFILLMQFLWKYVDDLVGKGLEWTVIIQLMFYASATLVPLALPLAILLSSIMTFGNLGENYELVALKSSGLSLQRIMLPLTILSVFISVLAFYFSNNILPVANLKMGSLLYDVRESKPAFNLKEGVFYNGMDGYSMKVGKKEQDGKRLKNIMIYDHTDFHGNTKVVYADSGKMEMSTDKKFLVITLYSGESYEDVIKAKRDKITHPLIRNSFREHTIYFDMSGFKLQRTDEDLFKSNYQMLNVTQLEEAIDSMDQKVVKKKAQFHNQIVNGYYGKVNNFNKNKDSVVSYVKGFNGTFGPAQEYNMLETASNIARSAKAFTESILGDLRNNEMMLIRHKIEWHKKFTLSFACLVLFFIGAPLGAIIRKGGMGMPVVVSVFFFIIFHVISITGEKSAKEGVIPPLEGMWLASAVLLPLGIFLTYKASTDSSIFDIDAYLQPVKKLFKRGKSKKVALS